MADRVPDNSPLHCAAFGGHKDVIELLINYGISMNAKKPYANGVHVNAITPFRKTPLFNAVEQGHKDAVEVLIANGANVNAGSGKYGHTVLHIAADQGNYDLVELLIANGAAIVFTSP